MINTFQTDSMKANNILLHPYYFFVLDQDTAYGSGVGLPRTLMAHMNCS